MILKKVVFLLRNPNRKLLLKREILLLLYVVICTLEQDTLYQVC